LARTYAASVYAAALGEIEPLFPAFADCTFEDGPCIGERRLVFANTQHDLVRVELFNRYYRLCGTERSAVGESFSAKWIENGDRSSNRELRVEVVLDRANIDHGLESEIRRSIEAGNPYPVNPAPRHFTYEAVGGMLVELSLPELVFLNWDAARKPPRDADEAMFAAVDAFDRNRIAEALAAGADPNAYDSNGYTALLSLIENDPWMFQTRAPGESWESLEARSTPLPCADRIACLDLLIKAGANVDLAGPNEVTPLVAAVLRHDADLVEHLLKMGADDSIECYDDATDGQWPTAWDHAAMDYQIASDEAERERTGRVWNTFCRMRQAPDGKRQGDHDDSKSGG